MAKFSDSATVILNTAQNQACRPTARVYRSWPLLYFALATGIRQHQTCGGRRRASCTSFDSLSHFYRQTMTCALTLAERCHDSLSLRLNVKFCFYSTHVMREFLAVKILEVPGDIGFPIKVHSTLHLHTCVHF